MKTTSNQTFGLLIFLWVTLILSGCAHQNLMEDGEKFLQQGRYELAVQKYQRAVALSPQDEESQRMLKQAQKLYQGWLQTVIQAARKAEQSGLQGKALVLYAKAASTDYGREYFSQYQSMQQNLWSKSQFFVVLTPKQQLVDIQQLEDVLGVKTVKALTGQSLNQATLDFNLVKQGLDIDGSRETRTTRYISGQEKVDNPKFLDLQTKIEKTRGRLAKYESDIAPIRAKISQKDQASQLLNKDLQIIELRLQHEAENSNYYQQLQQKRQAVVSKITKIQNEIKRLQNQKIRIEGYLDSTQTQLNNFLNALSYMKPTVLQDVYSDYAYPVKLTTQTAWGLLQININHKKSQIEVNVKDTTESYSAQPIIGLEAKPSVIKSKAHMEQMLQQELSQEALKQVQRLVSGFRSNLLREAKNQSNVNKKFENWVLYGLSGDKKMNPAILENMLSQLRLEFGQGGEFDILRLLNF